MTIIKPIPSPPAAPPSSYRDLDDAAKDEFNRLRFRRAVRAAVLSIDMEDTSTYCRAVDDLLAAGAEWSRVSSSEDVPGTFGCARQYATMALNVLSSVRRGRDNEPLAADDPAQLQHLRTRDDRVRILINGLDLLCPDPPQSSRT